MDYLNRLFDLNQKVVVITGASGQLGSEFSYAFNALGAKVIGLDKFISLKNSNCTEEYSVDITKKNEVLNVFKDIHLKYNHIDVLVNNAGISVFEPFEKRSEGSFDSVMDVNLKGTFFCIQSYVKLFDKSDLDQGAIVNIASHFGVVSPDFRNYTDCDRRNSEVYGATKAGVIQMTKYFAVYLADRKIRVNAVSPGGVYNPDAPQGDDFIRNYAFRCPMKRMAEASEFSGAVIYLASSAASYTTGQNVIVDGGVTCW